MAAYFKAKTEIGVKRIGLRPSFSLSTIVAGHSLIAL
jgi:hypothetical protein